MQIILKEYDPDWPIQFEKTKKTIEGTLGRYIASIEHIGSTSIPGLPAKPIVDMMVGLKDFSSADECVKGMISLGFKYIQTYEDEMPFRRFFTLKQPDAGKSFNIHMVEVDTPWWSRHLLFRNFLRAREDKRLEYLTLKQDLASRDWGDTNGYAGAKTPWIRAAEAEAAAFFAQ